jgi:lysophospholipase L1-like esterase
LKHGLLAYAGLTRPYRFERTLAVLAAFTLAIVIGAAAIHFHVTGKLHPGSQRCWYFVYMAALVALALLLVPWPRLAAVVLSLATLEAAFGLGTAYLYKVGLLAQTVFPLDEEAEYRFHWHPLLQGVPIPSGTDPQERDPYHNTLGQRGRERTPQSLDGKATIALFGGSTTYDVAVGEGETWGDRLEAMLGADRVAVINHGVPGYTTAEHVIQTAFYERAHGVSPRCSIYYIGWNDLRNSHVRNLDPGYADFHLRGQIDTLQVRRLRQSYVSFSPLLMFARYFLLLGIDTARPVDRPAGQAGAAPDPAMEAIYLRNVRTISAINRQRGITTLWVGQVLDHRRLLAGGSWRWIPFLRSQDVSPLILRLNDLLKREAETLGDIYVDIAPQDFTSDDFIDQGHFQPAGALKFAARLAPIAAAACR